jgi:hypothetical protein
MRSRNRAGLDCYCSGGERRCSPLILSAASYSTALRNRGLTNAENLAFSHHDANS